MHILETYALSTGSKINKPFVIKKFFPLPCDKYITIQNSSGMPGKCYDYFQEVIDFIYPYLEKKGYTIIQIGQTDDKALSKTTQLQGKTNINQTAYILDNSKLHIGNDSFAVHMCSSFETPVISLYGASSPDSSGPFWKNKYQVSLTTKNPSPSFNPNEQPKSVNEIKVEDILASVNSLLLNDDSIEKISTKFIGRKLKQVIVEATPDQVVSEDSFKGHLLNIRLDHVEEITEKYYESIAANLQIRKCCIVTDKAFEVEKFYHFKGNLKMIIYDVTKDLDFNFIKKCNTLGLKITPIFKIFKNSEEELLKRKVDLIDLPQIIEKIEKIDFDLKDYKDSTLYYKSNKFYISNNQIFLGHYGKVQKNPINIKDINVYTELNTSNKNLSLFLEDDLEHSFLFEKG